MLLLSTKYLVGFYRFFPITSLLPTISVSSPPEMKQTCHHPNQIAPLSLDSFNQGRTACCQIMINLNLRLQPPLVSNHFLQTPTVFKSSHNKWNLSLTIASHKLLLLEMLGKNLDSTTWSNK